MNYWELREMFSTIRQNAAVLVGACILFCGCSTTPSQSNKKIISYERLDPALIRAQSIEHKADIQECLRDVEKSFPKVITPRFAVNEDGEVIDVRIIQAPLENLEAEICLLQTFRKFRFPPLYSLAKPKISIKNQF